VLDYGVQRVRRDAMLAAGINSGIYKVLLVLHILSVVVGIGAVMLPSC
jgi:hypothetical protein